MTPIETSLWWIQYILENDGELITSHATNLSWFVYHSIDVLLLLGSIFIAVIYGIILLLKMWKNRAYRREIDNKKRE